MNTNYCERAGLRVATELAQLIEKDVAPAVGLDAARFWTGFAALLDQLVPVNQALLARRDQLQLDIDDWHRARRGQPFDVAAHEAHLVRSGYLVSEGPEFHIGTQNVDAEVARLAGPQLVVPLSNARYSLNAANARWGSLYDAFYGTDAIGETGRLARGEGSNAARGREVIARSADRYHFVERRWLSEPGFRVSGAPAPAPRDDEIVRAALAAPEVRGLKNWLRFPSFRVEETAGDLAVLQGLDRHGDSKEDP